MSGDSTLDFDAHTASIVQDAPCSILISSDALLARFYEASESELDWLRGGDFARLRLRLAQFVDRLRAVQCTPVVFFDTSVAGLGEASWKRRQWRRVRDSLTLVDALDATLLPEAVARALRSSLGLDVADEQQLDDDDASGSGGGGGEHTRRRIERARSCRPSYLDAALCDICHALKVGVLHALDGTLRELSYYCREEGASCRGVLANDPRLVLLPHVPRVFEARSLQLGRKASNVFYARTIERDQLAARIGLHEHLLPLYYLLTSAERSRAHVLELHAVLERLNDTTNNNNNNNDSTATNNTDGDDNNNTNNNNDNNNAQALRASDSSTDGGAVRGRHRRTFSSESDVILQGLSSVNNSADNNVPYAAVAALLRQHLDSSSNSSTTNNSSSSKDDADEDSNSAVAVLQRVIDNTDDEACRALAPHAADILNDPWLVRPVGAVDDEEETLAPSVRSALTIDVSDSSDESDDDDTAIATATGAEASQEEASSSTMTASADGVPTTAALVHERPRSPSAMLRDLVNRRVEHGFDDVLRELVHNRTLHGQVLFSDPSRPPPSDVTAPLRARIYAALFADGSGELPDVAVRETHVVLSGALQPDDTRATNGAALRRVLRRCVRSTTVTAAPIPLTSSSDRVPSFSAIGQYTQSERLVALLNVVGLPACSRRNAIMQIFSDVPSLGAAALALSMLYRGVLPEHAGAMAVPAMRDRLHLRALALQAATLAGELARLDTRLRQHAVGARHRWRLTDAHAAVSYLDVMHHIGLASTVCAHPVGRFYAWQYYDGLTFQAALMTLRGEIDTTQMAPPPGKPLPLDDIGNAAALALLADDERSRRRIAATFSPAVRQLAASLLAVALLDDSALDANNIATRLHVAIAAIRTREPMERLCKFFSTRGECPYGSRCHYVHMLPDGSVVNSRKASHKSSSQTRRQRSGSNSSNSSNYTKKSRANNNNNNNNTANNNNAKSRHNNNNNNSKASGNKPVFKSTETSLGRTEVARRVLVLLDGRADVRDSLSLAALKRSYASRYGAPLSKHVGRPVSFLRQYTALFNVAEGARGTADIWLTPNARQALERVEEQETAAANTRINATTPQSNPSTNNNNTTAVINHKKNNVNNNNNNNNNGKINNNNNNNNTVSNKSVPGNSSSWAQVATRSSEHVHDETTTPHALSNGVVPPAVAQQQQQKQQQRRRQTSTTSRTNRAARADRSPGTSDTSSGSEASTSDASLANAPFGRMNGSTSRRKRPRARKASRQSFGTAPTQQQQQQLTPNGTGAFVAPPLLYSGGTSPYYDGNNARGSPVDAAQQQQRFYRPLGTTPPPSSDAYYHHGGANMARFPPYDATPPGARTLFASPSAALPGVAPVLRLLDVVGLGRYAPLFEQHEVDREGLLLLGDNDLLEMGITAKGARVKLLAYIDYWRSIPPAVPLAAPPVSPAYATPPARRSKQLFSPGSRTGSPYQAQHANDDDDDDNNNNADDDSTTSTPTPAIIATRD